MSGILDGMRVVESSAFVAVPLAGMTLAQMGAEVIRLDMPQGGLDHTRWPVTQSGTSLFWAGLNKGKKSVAIDLKSPRGREIATEIICAQGDDAGHFITNLAVKGWTDYDTLSTHRPDLCMAQLRGDRHGRPAVDYTVNPSVGFPDVTGSDVNDVPTCHTLPAWDCIAGNMVVSGLLAAERQRLRKGNGQLVDLTLKDVAAAMLGNLGIIGEVMVNGKTRQKSGNSLYGAYGQDFICRDGRRVMVIGLTGRQWQNLMKATGTTQDMQDMADRLGVNLRDEGARWQARHEITAILAPWFAGRRVQDFADSFDALGVTWSVFRSFSQALAEDRDFSTENPMFSNVHQPGVGQYLTPGSPYDFSQQTREHPQPAPMLGQHTEEVLGDVAKLPETEIASLFDEGIVEQMTPEVRMAS